METKEEPKNTLQNRIATACRAIDMIHGESGGYDFYQGAARLVVEDCALAFPESRGKLLAHVLKRLRESGRDWRLQAMLIDLLLDLNEIGWRIVPEEKKAEFEEIIRRLLLPQTAEKILSGDLRQFGCHDKLVFIDPKRQIRPYETLIVDMARKALGLTGYLSPASSEPYRAFLEILRGDFLWFVSKECQKNKELGLATAPDFLSCFLKTANLSWEKANSCLLYTSPSPRD